MKNPFQECPLMLPVAFLVLGLRAQAVPVRYELAGSLRCWMCDAGDLAGFSTATFNLTALLDSTDSPYASSTYPPFSYAYYYVDTSLTIAGATVPGSNGMYSSTQGVLSLQDLPVPSLDIFAPAPFGYYSDIPFQFSFDNGTWSGASPLSPVFDSSKILLMYASVSYGFMGPTDIYLIDLTEARITIAPEIDIKPGKFPNVIHVRSQAVIDVAVLSAEGFDAETLDPATIFFGATGTEAAAIRATLEDVNGDGRLDMILRFRARDTGLECGDVSAALTAKTLDGRDVESSDSVKTVPCR